MYPTSPEATQQPVAELDGVKFYDIRRADQIGHVRFMAAEIQETYIRAGISEAFLSEIASLIIDRCDEVADVKSLKHDMRAIAMNLKGRMGMLADKKMYEDLACVYFMMEGEPTDYLPEWQARKKALWGRFPKERDFFIVEAFKHMGASENISMSDILSAFLIADERLQQLPTLPQS